MTRLAFQVLALVAATAAVTAGVLSWPRHVARTAQVVAAPTTPVIGRAVTQAPTSLARPTPRPKKKTPKKAAAPAVAASAPSASSTSTYVAPRASSTAGATKKKAPSKSEFGPVVVAPAE